MKCPDEKWPNGKQDRCFPKSLEFLSYDDTLGSVLAVTCILCAFFPFVTFIIFVKFRRTPLVKANNREISYLFLVALILCFLCSLMFIGHPETSTCLLRQALFGIIFTFCVSCVLAKTIMVVLAFNATKPNNHLKKWFSPKVSYAIIIMTTAVQFIICLCWLTASPPFPENTVIPRLEKIIVHCNEGTSIAFWCMLAYLSLLAGISFLVAFHSRKLPDSFNEAKFISFSMIVFLSVWLSFVPAYLSTVGKYTVAVEIFAILSSSVGLFGSIFAPKLYIIVLKPEWNTKKHLMGKESNDNRDK
ncbi:vomeronasal type-2 receptor 26-like [Protopterus annectens]|uniref:vomeronasal type-2 receptor 26-like n=1 Tax=Protopterus annectens TaxID=7888 RepID=UPI001CF9741E|nr:vomeronasal type-2 receptor 26-like [Protopterus annectens]